VPCHSGLPLFQQYGQEILDGFGFAEDLHLIIDAPWGFAYWGFLELPGLALIVTGCTSSHYLRDLMDRRPEGLISEPRVQVPLEVAVRRVAAGERFYQGPSLDGETLTPRERQVLRFTALGWSNQRIAQTLQVSLRTIYNWVHKLQDKLGLENRAQLALYYFGLLPYCLKWSGQAETV
jgi:DNA-binding CsgD family transcriptional regulator